MRWRDSCCAGVVFKFQRNFRAFGQPAHGVHEADVFVFLDEGEDVAALVAAEAVENLLVRIDVEAGRFFLVKRAKRGEVGAGAFQRQIRADDIHDVAGGADVFEGCGEEIRPCAIIGAPRRSIADVDDRRVFAVACFVPTPYGVDQQQLRLFLMGGPEKNFLKTPACTFAMVGKKSPLKPFSRRRTSGCCRP